MESLDVYLKDRKVGRLDDENGSLSFAYDEGYLADGACAPLVPDLASVRRRQRQAGAGAYGISPCQGREVRDALLFAFGADTEGEVGLLR